MGDALDKPVEVVEGLHEHARCNVKFLDKEKFEESVAQFFAQPDVLTFGSETADQAYHRFSRAVVGITAKYPNNNLALITHGTVLTLFVSRLAAVAPFLILEGFRAAIVGDSIAPRPRTGKGIQKY